MQYYSQNDPRWQQTLFTSNMTYGEGGCGATAVACIVDQLPTTVGNYLLSIGKVVDNQGTIWDGIPMACKHFGYDCIQLNSYDVQGNPDNSYEKQWLDAMKTGEYYGILLMGRNSFFSNAGHYIVATKVDSANNCTVHDVAYDPRSGTYGWTQTATPNNGTGGCNYYVPYFSGKVKIFYLIKKKNSTVAKPTTSKTTTPVTSVKIKFPELHVGNAKFDPFVYLWEECLMSFYDKDGKPYYNGKLDGLFGNKLLDATIRWQKATKDMDGKQLVADGKPGAKCWQRALKMKGIVSGSYVTFEFKQCESNKTSDTVRLVQIVLRAQNMYSGKLDKIYGNGTISGVKIYQKKYKLSVDGIAGIATINAMCGGK